jgi:Nucleotidyl transferase AbiEii toxin, Type IV TA system
MTSNVLTHWSNLTEEDKNEIFEQTGNATGLPNAAIEKDWWVVLCLHIIFKSSIASHTVFKGGTSLSKAWGLLDRFSEDIDLALDRSYLGFNKSDDEMTGAQVRKLREKSNVFITDHLFTEIKNAFANVGLADVQVMLADVKSLDADPIIIEVLYPSITANIDYIKPKVLIEIGSRSLIEPFTNRKIISMVGEYYKGQQFADMPLGIPAVNPERTFLEKIFLLHEEFQQPKETNNINRRSRHLYDIEKMMDTPFALKALQDKVLYNHIVLHRSKLNAIRGLNYANHHPSKINIIPPKEIYAIWQNDYAEMQTSMIQNESLPFSKLIERLQLLQTSINALDF